MTTTTLNRTQNMLTVTLPADCTQEAWESALDWVSVHARAGSEGTFVDHGDVQIWLFPAAA